MDVTCDGEQQFRCIELAEVAMSWVDTRASSV